MHLGHIKRLGLLCVDETESGNDQAPADLRAWLQDNASDVAEATGLDVSAFADWLARATDIGPALVRLCSDRGTRKASQDARRTRLENEAAQCASMLVATSYADVDGLHLDGPALAALARVPWRNHVALSWGHDVPAIAVPRQAIVAFARVHSPDTWRVTVEHGRIVIRVVDRNVVMRFGCHVLECKLSTDENTTRTVYDYHGISGAGMDISASAYVTCFADHSDISPMPAAFPSCEYDYDQAAE